MKSLRGKHAIIALLALAATVSGCAKQEAQGTVSGGADAAIRTQPAGSTVQPRAALASAGTIKVYKDPNCGCCNNWVDHLREHGFTVETMDMPDLSMLKERYAIGPSLRACHTAVVGDYAIEGHVPADLIERMLKEKPAIAGLAVPGMPMGSPGMEGATKERYDVLTFDRAGRTTVYAQR